MNNWWRMGLGVMLILLSGCASTYRFKVDALAAPESSAGQAFLIEAPRGEGPGSQLRYREAADYVERALLSRGLVKASGPTQADMIISLEAKVSDPLSETEWRSEPIYYRTWGHSRIIRTPVLDSEGKIRYVATRIYVPPTTRFAGYQDYTTSVVVYEKQLDLTARTPGGEELWTVSVRTVDQSSDLRSYIPLLTAAALPYVGETTDGAVLVSLREDDESVQYLRDRAPAES